MPQVEAAQQLRCAIQWGSNSSAGLAWLLRTICLENRVPCRGAWPSDRIYAQSLNLIYGRNRAIVAQVIIRTGEKSAVRHNEQAHLARRLLERGYATPITIEQLSREVALSPYYLIRLFRRIYQQTPHQYLIQVRIARAKELLSSSDLSITEICADVGFESLGSFSTLFRKTVGISPSAFRRSSQSIRKSVCIPLCVCLLHGIPDSLDG